MQAMSTNGSQDLINGLHMIQLLLLSDQHIAKFKPIVFSFLSKLLPDMEADQTIINQMISEVDKVMNGIASFEASVYDLARLKSNE